MYILEKKIAMKEEEAEKALIKKKEEPSRFAKFKEVVNTVTEESIKNDDI